MGIINIVKNIKEIHEDYVVIVRVGNFFNCYGRDAYIIAYLFHYKVSLSKDNYYMTSFPNSAFNKVIAKLEEKKINYIILDKRNNYEVEEKYNYKNLNRYQETYVKAKENIAIKMRIEKIYKELNEQKNTELISIIERVINERRKI